MNAIHKQQFSSKMRGFLRWMKVKKTVPLFIIPIRLSAMWVVVMNKSYKKSFILGYLGDGLIILFMKKCLHDTSSRPLLHEINSQRCVYEDIALIHVR